MRQGLAYLLRNVSQRSGIRLKSHRSAPFAPASPGNRPPRNENPKAGVSPLTALLHDLAMQRQIEAFALDLFADAQPDDHVDDLEDDQGHDHVVDEHDRRRR